MPPTIGSRIKFIRTDPVEEGEKCKVGFNPFRENGSSP